MRILWFNAGLPPRACKKLGFDASVGGGWIESMLDALQIVEEDNEYCVLCLDGRPCDLTIGRVRYVSVPGGFTYDRIPESLQKAIRDEIVRFSPDVIHIQGTEYFFGRMNPAIYCGKPVVVSIQGVLSEYWIHHNGGLAPMDIRFCELLNPRALLRGRTVEGERTIWRTLRAEQEQDVFRQQRNFIGRTEWDRHCLAFYNTKARYFHVNENLRQPFYTIRRDPKAIRRHSIYCAGAASYPLKGAHFLLRAIAALKEEFPDIQLRIAGAERIFQGPRNLREWIHEQVYYPYLRRLVKKLKIERHVVALPSLNAEQVAQELSQAELYVSASLCENSPNSLGEAMLVGTPIIQTFVGGVPSILKDGEEGKLVPPYDPHALAGAIRDRFLHPEIGESMGAAARATALKRHDARANAEATLAVYREVCG